MPKYLLRRRNRYGQYVHLATYDYEPNEWQIKNDFGPGEYSILISREGVIGVRKFDDISIPWDITYVGWVDGQPTIEYLQQHYGPGSYFVLKSCQVNPLHVPNIGQEYSKITYDMLQDGAPVMRNISIIFRVEGMPWL
jgi:hypothetical protein